MNANHATKEEEVPQPIAWWTMRFNTLMLIWAITLIFITAFAVPAISCACGYMTPTTLPHAGGVASFAWIPFCVPGRKQWVTRLVLIMAVVFATGYFGRNLADVLWLSPHAGKWTH